MTPVLLTILSAGSYALAFPPWSAWWWAYAALAPFFIACTRVAPRRAALLGLLWGVVAGYGVGWWFPEMLGEYFELPGWATWAGFLASTLALAGSYYAAFGAWLSWTTARRRANPALVAAAWTAGEFARASLVSPNPWALVGYSQAPFTTVIQIADLAGPYGIGFLVAWSNAALAARREPRLGGTRPARAAAATAAAFLAVVAYGQYRLAAGLAAGDAIDVALVQGATERQHAWRPQYWRHGLDRYLKLTDGLRADAVDLIVWPENAINFYLQEESEEQRSLLAASRRFSGDLVLGGPRYRFSTSGTAYFNSAFLVRSGRVLAVYDKHRLLPFAEERVLGRFGDARMSYTRGSRIAVMQTVSGSVGTFICVEGVYPEYVRQLVRTGAELLVEISNDAWFRYDGPARHHLEMTALRAVENRRYLVRAVSTGISAVVDPFGRIVAQVPLGARDAIVERVHRHTIVSPYTRVGDLFAWLAVAAVLLSIVAPRRDRATREIPRGPEHDPAVRTIAEVSTDSARAAARCGR